ncbi:MAG: ribonuclease Y [Phycisphaeraceae bacterium]|nr:ribonuclease Y [Phycisphaeraceae bacterium]
MSMNRALLLAEVGNATATILAVGGLVVGAALGFLLLRLIVGRSLGEAKAEAAQIVERAKADAQTSAEKIRLQADREALERKEKGEAEIEQARNEVRDQERRLSKREDLVTRREETLDEKDRAHEKAQNALREREAQIAERTKQADTLVEEQRRKLHQIADLSKEQAREELLLRAEDENRAEVGKVVRRINEQAEEQAKEKSREILLMAIQRFASEVTSESTVRSVEIPSDDLKGRIIGREGRNIRAIEKATGVDIIVDDTPGVIVVSCFDKVRQAIAVEALNRLIADGRMHPARIEEVVRKVTDEMAERVTKIGKDAVLEVDLRAVHPKISEAMGKLHFRTSYAQNVLRHSIEVAYFCQIIADQLGLDGRLAKRCGFLHDIGKAMDHEMEGGHPKIGMDFARQYGEKEAVLNAIGGHHGDIPATTFYTPIVMAADAVSSARPGARRESMERYVQRLNDLQDIALAFRGVTEAYAIQAGREVRVMIDAARIGDDEAYLIAHKIAKRVSEEMTFPGEIKVTVLRETRAIEIAR